MPDAVVFRVKAQEDSWWAVEDVDGMHVQFGRAFAGPDTIVIPPEIRQAETISRRHFCFSRAQGAYWIEDLGSENLTVVIHRTPQGRVSERIVFAPTETTLPCEVRAGDVTLQIQRHCLSSEALSRAMQFLPQAGHTLHTTNLGTTMGPYARSELRWAAAVDEISTMARRHASTDARCVEAAAILEKYFRAARAAMLRDVNVDDLGKTLNGHGYTGWDEEHAARVLQFLDKASSPTEVLRLDMPGGESTIWVMPSHSSTTSVWAAIVDFSSCLGGPATYDKAGHLVELTFQILMSFALTEREVASTRETVEKFSMIKLGDALETCCAEEGFCVSSPATKDLLSILEMAATRLFQGERLPLPVILLQGERGAGKTKLVNLLRRLCGRPQGPVVHQNCANIPPDLAESTLFGHVKGAFTHATADKPGLLETAENGILFLDEIGDLSPELQPKLLTVLESGAFRPVGATHERNTNCYIVAASNRDLEQLCRGGLFREDLYDRIATVRIEVPPLRERPEEIPLLAQAFVDLFNKERTDQPVKRISDELLKQLKSGSWPGNVRQLRSFVENLCLFSPVDKCVIDLSHIPQPIQSDLRAVLGGPTGRGPASPTSPFDLSQDLKWHTARCEREYLIRLFVLYEGNKSKTIAQARMNHNVFYGRLKQWRQWIDQATEEDQDEIAHLRDLAGAYWNRLWTATDNDLCIKCRLELAYDVSFRLRGPS